MINLNYELGWTCSTNEEMRNAYTVLLGRTEERRPLERHVLRWESNI
jgi:hypothetical protein